MEVLSIFLQLEENPVIIVICALTAYLVGSIAGYLLQWWFTGRRGDLFAFMFKPWTENRNWLIQRDDDPPDG